MPESIKPELTSRVLAIDIVSWKWNKKGLGYHLKAKQFSKLLNKRETGVIAQQVKEQLGPAIPKVVVEEEGVLKVDYGYLAAITYEVAKYLDAQYQQLRKKDSAWLDLDSLIESYAPPEQQAGAVALLAITKLYARKIEGHGGTPGRY